MISGSPESSEYYASSEDYAMSNWLEWHADVKDDYSSKNELMWFCDDCQAWHNTDAGDRLDELYADVFPKSAYTYYHITDYAF